MLKNFYIIKHCIVSKTLKRNLTFGINGKIYILPLSRYSTIRVLILNDITKKSTLYC